MDYYEVTTEPADPPVTLDEAKAYMKITSSAEDAVIQALLDTAVKDLEDYTGMYFVLRTVQGEFANVLRTKKDIYPFAKLRRAPLGEITSVQFSRGGTFTDEPYQVKRKNHGFSRVLFSELFYQGNFDDIPYPLQIVFTAGYPSARTVPETIKTAIKEYVNFLHKNRADCIDQAVCNTLIGMAGLPAHVKAMLGRYRIIEVFA